MQLQLWLLYKKVVIVDTQTTYIIPGTKLQPVCAFWMQAGFTVPKYAVLGTFKGFHKPPAFHWSHTLSPGWLTFKILYVWTVLKCSAISTLGQLVTSPGQIKSLIKSGSTVVCVAAIRRDDNCLCKPLDVIYIVHMGNSRHKIGKVEQRKFPKMSKV